MLTPSTFRPSREVIKYFCFDACFSKLRLAFPLAAPLHAWSQPANGVCHGWSRFPAFRFIHPTDETIRDWRTCAALSQMARQPKQVAILSIPLRDKRLQVRGGLAVIWNHRKYASFKALPNLPLRKAENPVLWLIPSNLYALLIDFYKYHADVMLRGRCFKLRKFAQTAPDEAGKLTLFFNQMHSPFLDKQNIQRQVVAYLSQKIDVPTFPRFYLNGHFWYRLRLKKRRISMLTVP